MAENDAADAKTDGQQAAEKKGSKLWLWIILVLIILGAGGGAAWYFLMGSKPAPDQDADAAVMPTSSKPHYLELNPGFVVNLNDPDLMRYLQLDIQLMSHDSDVLKETEKYMPEIRNRVLLLLAQQKFEDLVPRTGKEALQKAALNEINAVLRENGVEKKIKALYFTSFVMQ